MKIINKLENYAACIIFILLIALPFSDLVIREIIRPFISNLPKIPASQTLVSHLTLLIGFSGAIIASRDNKLLSLSNTTLFDGKTMGFGKHIAKWISLFTDFPWAFPWEFSSGLSLSIFRRMFLSNSPQDFRYTFLLGILLRNFLEHFPYVFSFGALFRIVLAYFPSELSFSVCLARLERSLLKNPLELLKETL